MCKRVRLTAASDGNVTITPTDCHSASPNCRAVSKPWVDRLGTATRDTDLRSGRSHIVTIDVKFNDIEAVKAACARLGWEFREGQTAYRWFGRWVDDSPVPRHLFADEETYNRVLGLSKEARQTFMDALLGRCEHAIRVPGAEYEIGLQQVGGSFVPVWDWYECGGLSGVMAQTGGVLAQAYAVEKAKLEAQRMGYPAAESVLEDGSVVLEIVESY